MQDTCKVHTKSLKGSNIQGYLNLVIFYVFKTGFNQVVLIITILFLSSIFLEKLLKKKKILIEDHFTNETPIKVSCKEFILILDPVNFS